MVKAVFLPKMGKILVFYGKENSNSIGWRFFY